MRKVAVFAAAWLIAMAGLARAGAESPAELARTAGVGMACTAADTFLQVQRRADATEVVQTGPRGVNWRVRLPPMQGPHLPVYLSPRGDAAVVASSLRDGAEFLVTGAGGAVPIDAGVVQAVDFEAGRVLVVIGEVVDGELRAGRRARVYDVGSGALVGDTRFEDADPPDVWTLERDWSVRLTGDGRAYYYVREYPPAGGRRELVVRDVASGARTAWPLARADGAGIQQVYDAVLPSAQGGFLADGRVGRLYRIGTTGLAPLAVPTAIGGVEDLAYSTGRRQLGVVGTEGWGVLDLAGGDWRTLTDHQHLVGLRAVAEGWLVLDEHAGHTGMRLYDRSAGTLHAVREVATDTPGDPLVCANAYGLMRYRDGRFRWQPARPATD